MFLRLSKYRLLLVLGAGFALVIVLLSAMAWLSWRQTRLIRRDAATLVREHLFAARLVDALEQEQQRATALLLGAVRLRTKQASRVKVLDELATFQASLPPLIEEGARMLPDSTWTQLTEAARLYGELIRTSCEQATLDETQVNLLERRHDELTFLFSQIIKRDALRSAELESAIEQESSNLAGGSNFLLAGSILLALACAISTIRMTFDQLRRLTRQAQALNRVTWHLIQGQEEAARRFSHEMHDELGQALAGLKATLQTVTVGTFDARRTDCIRTLDEAIGNVRELSQLLRPVILDDFGLEAALRWLTERFQERTRIEVSFDADFHGRLADEVETHLFRISQEALTNVARHAGATAVQMKLASHGAAVTLTIADNGVGLQRNQAPSLGLIGMRARAEQLDGTFDLVNQVNGGVIVKVTVPARPPATETAPQTELVYERSTHAHSVGR